MGRIIVHIDLNAFFVRCEEIKDPSLMNKPVAIGHQGRSGIVSTCSYEARKYGVSSGMPMFQATAKCPNLIIKPVDFKFYHLLSGEFFKFVKSYTKYVEEASVDECYADFTDALKGVKNIKEYFEDFQRKLFEKTKLNCSIGIASTKFLAKMGSDLKKPNGLTMIRKKDIPSVLYPLPIENMYGIGKKTYPRLKSIGIHTIGDLMNRINEKDQDTFNILGKFFYVVEDLLTGKSDDVVNIEADDPKSIGHSTTLINDTSNYEEIKGAFSALSKMVAQRAIEQSKVGTTVQIVVKEPSPSFKTHNKSISFKNPTNEYSVIFEKAMNLYDKNFTDMTVRLVGVTLQNLISVKDIAVQMTFFDYEEHEKENATKLLINELNRKLKKPLLLRASEVKGKKK